MLHGSYLILPWRYRTLMSEIMHILVCYGKSLNSGKLIFFLLKEYHFRDFIVCDFLFKQLESLSGDKRLMDCVEKREKSRNKNVLNL